jgi:hypothetical protein
MQDQFNTAGQSAWEHCSTEQLLAMGLLSEDDVNEMFDDLEANLEALPMAA